MNAKPARTGAADWASIRARLQAAIAATEAGERLSPQRERELLESRARRLAQVPVAAAPPGDELELVTFVLGGERYGIETRFVREVLRLSEFTPIPGAPVFVVGLTNLRGELLLVVDLRRFFGIAVRGVTDLSRLIVLGGANNELGVLADAIDDVLRLRAGDLAASPETLPEIERGYLRGVTREALIVLAGDTLLRDRRLFIDENGSDE